MGSAAREVARILHPHFEKEEGFALPPLGALNDLVKGKAVEEGEVLKMTDRLKAELPQMIKEHRQIIAALEKFGRMAKNRERTEYVEFVERLVQHAKMEEEVLYPASLLIGEYLRKLG